MDTKAKSGPSSKPFKKTMIPAIVEANKLTGERQQGSQETNINSSKIKNQFPSSS